LRFTYRYTYSWNPEALEEKNTDMQILDIGNTMSKYYSVHLQDFWEYVKRWWAETGRTDVIPANPEKGTQPYEIYKNYPSNGIMSLYDISSLFYNNAYFYEDPVPAINWKLHEEYTTVLGYNCQKANASFLGRNYIVWFAREIPVSNGPWKFGGLPGLIMKATDSENQFDFECIGMEQPDGELIKKYDGNFQKISHEDYEKLFHRMYDDNAAFMTFFGMRTARRINGEVVYITSGAEPIPYNAIER
jgi:GLPGLI family protein